LCQTFNFFSFYIVSKAYKKPARTNGAHLFACNLPSLDNNQ
jgi:hypothetical protein